MEDAFAFTSRNDISVFMGANIASSAGLRFEKFTFRSPLSLGSLWDNLNPNGGVAKKSKLLHVPMGRREDRN